ncbi:MAG: tRNA (adenosine(37)-N6)-dimethylallyltransferase MiaA [Candidatus Peribacteraceae bacterium]|nr:tRNA (adenosine(37)-N6)-dimethylallyltransferase MiaA [Candidatus Peribacteraceae bacterium]MDD5742695.1 tRNA (adenosine(37)-N6)-dimethylallyltransferase MiaA [Candidatus Peribacteraceae bacterium]
MLLRIILKHLRTARQPLLVLVGPTASGKTDLSLSIAEGLRAQGRGVEIINADSRQLYRHLNIGTGKIRFEEMHDIPHHLFDVLDPKEEVTAAWYKREAERVIAEIHARGNIPFLVGGSMLYVSAVIDNRAFVETPDPALRQELEKELQQNGADVLHRRLQKLDPEGALGVDPMNAVYLLRALEVCLSTGMCLKEAKRKHPSSYDLFILGINPPRATLCRRIDERVRAMFKAGWAEEVQSLLDRGYTRNDPGMRSHGYREIADALLQCSVETVKGDSALHERIAASSRQYAKRQMTWWKHDSRIRWMSPSPGAPHHPLPGGEGRR